MLRSKSDMDTITLKIKNKKKTEPSPRLLKGLGFCGSVTKRACRAKRERG